MRFLPSTPIIQVKHIGPRLAKKAEALGIRSIQDLLWHFPFRYDDFSHVTLIRDLHPGEQATIQGVVETIDTRKSWRRRMVVVEAMIRDRSGLVRAVWFNQPYLATTLNPGRTVSIAGRVAEKDEEVYFSHPEYEVIHAKTEDGAFAVRHTGRLVPVYPETKGLTSRMIRFLVHGTLGLLPLFKEWLPDEVLEAENLPAIEDAVRQIHFPESEEAMTQARRRFSFENLFLLQLVNLADKAKRQKEAAPPIKIEIERIKEILEYLPFTLTPSQKKCLWEMVQDLERPHPMNRLLQGDVGSGKTAIAALAAFFAAEAGYEAVIMAPTEVLATQHYETVKKLFHGFPRETQLPIGLLTSNRAAIFFESDLEQETTKDKMKLAIKNREVKIIIGTHALIQKGVSFSDLGLVVVDEQHRFGVEQRAELLRQQTAAPHFLSMSATPIPRTLMLTMFGDLDISTITEMPAGRKPIVTKVVSPQDRRDAYTFIRTEIKKGRQAFVICPRIEPTDPAEQKFADFKKLELKSVKEEYEKLSAEIFPDLVVGMLHGQMPAKEKAEVMKKFSAGKIQMLVSTSVIEVGVDVPNATVMMIEGSDRFGLAQLYQFRGRVGRGTHQSYCLLFTDSSAGTTKERLKAIVQAKNGFELAEKDLEIRGPGQFLGNEQTGMPDSLMSGLQNIELIKSSRATALHFLSQDPGLKKYPALRKKVEEFRRQIHQE